MLWAPSFLNRSESGIPIPIGHRRELGVIYKQAFDPNGNTQSASAVPYSRFQQLEAFVRGTIPLNEDNKIDLKINAGTYLSREYLSPSDEKYFALAPVIDRTPFKDNWATLPPFFTGGKSWTTQEVNFYSNRFLLSRTKGFGGFFRMMMRSTPATSSPEMVVPSARSATPSAGVTWHALVSSLGMTGRRHDHTLPSASAYPVLCLSASASERY